MSINEETNELITLLKDAKFEEAKQHLESKEGQIFKYWRDDTTGNSFIHLALIRLIEELRIIESKLSYVSRPYFDNDYSVLSSAEIVNEVKEESKSQVDGCLNFVEKCLALSFPSDYRNLKSKRPLELFQTCPNICRYPTSTVYSFSKYLSIPKLEKNFTQLFEKYTKTIYSGVRYVNEFTLFREGNHAASKAIIPDIYPVFDDEEQRLTLHQALELHGKELRKILNLQSSHKNIVIGNLGFILSEGPYYGNRHSTKQFLTYPIGDDDSLAHSNGTSDSEIALCDYLLTSHYVDKVVGKLLESLNNLPQYKIYAVVLDFNSTNRVCDGCASHLRNLQATGELIAKIQRLLTDKGFILPSKRACREERDLPENECSNKNKIPLIIRASGNGKGGSNHSHIIYKGDFERNIKNHYQGVLFHLNPDSDASIAKPKQASLQGSNLKYTAFMSRTFPGTIRS